MKRYFTGMEMQMVNKQKKVLNTNSFKKMQTVGREQVMAGVGASGCWQ